MGIRNSEFLISITVNESSPDGRRGMFHGSTQRMEPLDNSEEGFVAMGTYQITDAQKLLEAFELKGIEFRAEFDDGIADVSNRGSYGLEAHAIVCVRAE